MTVKIASPRADAVHIHLQGEADIVVGITPVLKTIAMRWAYVVRNRVRWAEDKDALAKMRESARKDLNDIGISDESLLTLAEAEIVEIEVPFVAEELGWEARILPWEFLLAATTAEYRTSGDLVVVRRLQTGAPPALPRTPATVAVVSSLPGKLTASGYRFESEIALVQSNLALEDPAPLVNPTLAGLTEALKAKQPDVVHLAGMDLHQGYRILGKTEDKPNLVHDGYFLTGQDGSEYPATSLELARAVNAGARKPLFVCVNTCNSAARTAALIVAQGTQAAIGFQDEIDDLVAEHFLTQFYRAWRELRWDVLRAFRAAFREITDKGTTKIGTGIVLWSREPLLQTLSQASMRDDQEQLRKQSAASAATPKAVNVLEDLDLDIVPVASINYSLLHNKQPLFNRFCLRNLNRDSAPILGIRLHVELCAGEQVYPFRTMLDLPAGTPKELRGDICTPLTSTLFRSLRESIQSVLYVKVIAGDTEVRVETHAVRLLAIDEWLDELQLNAFLPSFVLPRDPGVLRVIDAAQRHLMTLTDDPDSGFDGYQGVEPESADPGEPVDLQVWAIWSALCHDFEITYINPPPTFTEHSQRLRSPSDVVEGLRGTCIDLALLLAACLEYVGIYPVLFLLEGHAFAGYWRTETSRERFVQVLTQPDEAAAIADTQKKPSPYPWLALQQSYDEILALVRRGDLAPLETVWITQRKGYWDARDAGVEDLRSRVEFESLIDIKGARDQQVTPLPVTKG